MYGTIGTYRIMRGTLPPGDRGTVATLDKMRALVNDGARQLDVRETALRIVRAAGIRAHDGWGEIRALFRFVRDQVRFTSDPVGVELLQSPRYTLDTMAGDCDDRAVLLAALARSIGLPLELRFKVIAVNPSQPRSFSHVYLTARRAGRMVALDPTYPNNALGWEHPRPFRVSEVAI